MMNARLVHICAAGSPAGHDDDILRDVGHLFDGQVAHPSQSLLKTKTC